MQKHEDMDREIRGKCKNKDRLTPNPCTLPSKMAISGGKKKGIFLVNNLKTELCRKKLGVSVVHHACWLSWRLANGGVKVLWKNSVLKSWSLLYCFSKSMKRLWISPSVLGDYQNVRIVRSTNIYTFLDFSVEKFIFKIILKHLLSRMFPCCFVCQYKK